MDPAMHEPLDCPQIHAIVRAGRRAALDEPAVQDHLRACSACAVLVEGDAVLAGTLAAAEHGSELSSDALDRMLAQLETETSARPLAIERIRQLSTRTRSVVLLGSAAAGIGLAQVLSPVVDMSGHSPARVLGTMVALIAAVLAAGVVVLRPLHRRPLPGWSLALLAGFSLIVPTTIAALPAPAGSPTRGDEHFVTHALACFAFGMVFAIMLIGVAWLVERSGLRRHASTLLGLVGAGALANLLLVLHCPDPAPLHKLAGHASISAVLLAVAGVIAAWLTVRPRAR